MNGETAQGVYGFMGDTAIDGLRYDIFERNLVENGSFPGEGKTRMPELVPLWGIFPTNRIEVGGIG